MDPELLLVVSAVIEDVPGVPEEVLEVTEEAADHLVGV